MDDRWTRGTLKWYSRDYKRKPSIRWTIQIKNTKSRQDESCAISAGMEEKKDLNSTRNDEMQIMIKRIFRNAPSGRFSLSEISVCSLNINTP